MADYSWVRLEFRSKNPKVREKVRNLLDALEGDVGRDGEWSSAEGETAFGMAEEVEEYLTEKGIAWSRYSDGKYEYDGDEAHWRPGMPAPRVFARLNNGGRVFTEAELEACKVLSDAELGAFVREFFAFKIEQEEVALA